MTNKPGVLLLLFLLCMCTGIAQSNCHNCSAEELNQQLAIAGTDTGRVRILQLLTDKNNISALDETRDLIDQLLAANKKTKTINEAPYKRLYEALGMWKNGNPAAALTQLKEVVRLFDKEKKPVYELLSGMRILFALLDKPGERKDWYAAKLEYYTVNGMYENTAACYHALGGYYVQKADYNLAISNYLRAAAAYKSFHNQYYYNTLSIVGGLYEKWGNPDKAIGYLTQALPLAQAKNDSNITAYILVALTRISLYNKQPEEALGYVNNAIAFSKANNAAVQFDATTSIALLQKGFVLLQQNKPGEAAPFLEKVKQSSDQHHPRITTLSGNLEVNYALFRYYSQLQQFGPAEKELLQAYQKATQENSKVLEQKYLNELVLFYHAQKQPAKTAPYFGALLKVNADLEKEQNTIKVATYEDEAKEAEQNERLTQLRQEKAVQEEKISNRNTILLITIIGFLLVVALLISIYRQLNYKRKTLRTLRTTQRKLILAEKMASLGELTTGIAHEIQNPLNFVQNFTEVSSEMAKELEAEVEAGNKEMARELVSVIQQNLSKILYHSKRAATIVKGMLLYTQQGSGKKEPVNLNLLIEEYLTVSYKSYIAQHGHFTAGLHTTFDPSVGAVQLVPLDLGRVLASIFNNAFYAMNQKQKSEPSGFKPRLDVATTRTTTNNEDKVEIRIKDNGPGIENKIIDKIFQPFYTTKPTGQGTGLGLFLSYDIVTKGHSGKMEVETEPGAYAMFIISLPIIAQNLKE